MGSCTYTNVKCLETVACSRAQRHHLRPGIGNTNLKVAIGILLLKNNANSLLNINQEAPGASDALFIVG